MRELARAGAEPVLKRLRVEITAIERAFPELVEGRKGIRRSVKRVRRRTRRMSAAAKKAISKRMKKYWAERKNADGNK
jgi:hypothetical protein